MYNVNIIFSVQSRIFICKQIISRIPRVQPEIRRIDDEAVRKRRLLDIPSDRILKLATDTRLIRDAIARVLEIVRTKNIVNDRQDNAVAGRSHLENNLGKHAINPTDSENYVRAARLHAAFTFRTQVINMN
ncbi:hypothetical protein O3G_MSEX013398 [Manduca sexta]|uniref:Uncharacterized protein n=1 Tax=Manduca sexta TaxID=7130 RepID=A0A922CX10_MANSE|nr:hypothetical protein O3G_MSEX013398 [Manduca sexta]